ncbi:MAG: SPOR domain-containing protein [Paludibacteraceae bacterium]|nr:SPOR domain-containing protein [Paludibacteraceae bacterium]MBR6493579.1 SPOR domain-containing protein [Paludibacteraceae bacterium]
MKRVIIILLAACATMLWAEDSIMVAPSVEQSRPNLLDSMPGVEVLQDSAVAQLLEGVKGTLDWVEIDGYRVQIYSSNQQQYAKTEALDLESKLQDKVNHTIYVQYIPPFWKVRIGDFRSYEDAKEYKKLFVLQYPEMLGDTYIVRDKVKVLQ